MTQTTSPRDKLSAEDKEKANALHKKLFSVLNESEKDYKTKDKETALNNDKKRIKKIQDLEFQLQDIFGFSRNADYHTYWFRLATCECPFLDNKDRYGTPYSVVNLECPLHKQQNK